MKDHPLTAIPRPVEGMLRDSPTTSRWLTVLWALLLIWGPATFVVRASRDVAAWQIRNGVSLGALLICDFGVTACGAAAAVSLMNRRAIGVPMARAALIGGAGVDLIRYTTTIAPNNLIPGDSGYYVAVSLLYHLAWLAYLFRSKHVREILSD
jgi:hypothetical protein